MTKDEIKEQLDELGVAYDADATKADLEALLPEEEEAEEDAAPEPKLEKVEAPHVDVPKAQRRTLADFKVINGFVLENDEKLRRAIYGEIGREGTPVGGVGEDADPYDVLVAYDQKGGYITHDGAKVENGAFYDYQTKLARPEPDITYVYNIGGNFIRVKSKAELEKEVLKMNGIGEK